MVKTIIVAFLTSLMTAGIVAVLLVGGAKSQPEESLLGRSGTAFPHGISVGDGVGSGCIQVYATSSATVGKFVASTTDAYTGSDGVVMFRYGTCL